MEKYLKQNLVHDCSPEQWNEKIQSLQELMQAMQKRIHNPLSPNEVFAGLKTAEKNYEKRYSSNVEDGTQACYVFLDKNKTPFYVGISQHYALSKIGRA